MVIDGARWTEGRALGKGRCTGGEGGRVTDRGGSEACLLLLLVLFPLSFIGCPRLFEIIEVSRITEFYIRRE